MLVIPDLYSCITSPSQIRSATNPFRRLLSIFHSSLSKNVLPPTFILPQLSPIQFNPTSFPHVFPLFHPFNPPHPIHPPRPTSIHPQQQQHQRKSHPIVSSPPPQFKRHSKVLAPNLILRSKPKSFQFPNYPSSHHFRPGLRLLRFTRQVPHGCQPIAPIQLKTKTKACCIFPIPRQNSPSTRNSQLSSFLLSFPSLPQPPPSPLFSTSHT